MATDGKKLNQLPELTTLSDATMLYAVDGGEDYHVNFETIKDETVPEVFTPTTNGLVPHPNSGNGGKVLRGDGTWQGTFDSSNDGLVPKLGTNDKDNVLCGDGTWVANDKLIGTGSGSLVTFDAIEAPMPSLKVSVEAKQDLHGYDKPWVGGAGKNKAEINVTDVALTEITDSDGNKIGFKYNSTVAQSYVITIKVGEVSIKSGKTYTLSGSPSGFGNDSYRLDVRSGNTVYNNWNETNNATITASEDITLSIYVRIAANYVMSQSLIFKPQIEEGSSATPFAPYSNICHISGWDAANVSDVGKNLFDKDNAYILTGRALNSQTGEAYVTSNWSVSYYIEIEPSTTYTLNTMPSGSNSVAFYDSEKVYISGSGSFGTKTTPSNAKYLRFDYKTEYLSIMQLELGSTASEYVPYVEPNLYTISLPQTVYGGELDVVNGGGKNNLAYIELPSTGWAQESGETSVFTNYAIKAPTAYPQLICSHATRASSYNDVINNEGKIGLSASRVLWHTTFTTVEEFEQYLANNTVQIAYELATPTTFTTQPTPIKSLNGQNNLSVDTGEVMEVEYQRSITEAINALEAGGGYSETSLWSNSSGVYTGDLALSDSIENYNALMFKVSNAQGWANFAIIPTSALASNDAKAGIGGGMQGAAWWFQFTRTDATHITINNNSSTGDKLYQIIGVKY